MRWNGSRHFELRATPQMGRSCGFQVKKRQLWPICKAHDAMEWQFHFEHHATPQMGRRCRFLCGGEGEPEEAALAELALDADGSVMSLDG